MSIAKSKSFKRGIYVGACPQCGDDVSWYKAKGSRKRFCRCANPECKFSGPIPQKGRLFQTGVTCPGYEGIVLGVETWPTDNPADCRRYFWQAGPNPCPCVNCRAHAKCSAIRDAAEGLGVEWATAGGAK